MDPNPVKAQSPLSLVPRRPSYGGSTSGVLRIPKLFRRTVQCAPIRLQNNHYVITVIQIVRPVRART